MQVTETLNEGLKREIKVVVPAGDLEAKLSERLETARGRAKINGFRPARCQRHTCARPTASPSWLRS